MSRYSNRYSISLAALIGLRAAQHDQNLTVGGVILNAYHRQHNHLAAPPPSSGIRPPTGGSIGALKVGTSAALTAEEANLLKEAARAAGYPNVSLYVNALLLTDLNIDPARLKVTIEPPATDRQPK